MNESIIASQKKGKYEKSDKDLKKWRKLKMAKN